MCPEIVNFDLRRKIIRQNVPVKILTLIRFFNYFYLYFPHRLWQNPSKTHPSKYGSVKINVRQNIIRHIMAIMA
jgi:hypothetical protein